MILPKPLVDHQLSQNALVGLDYGGTLLKIAYIDASGSISFMLLDSHITDIHNHADIPFTESYIGVTGGGSYKHSESLDALANAQGSLGLTRVDEMGSVVLGMNYILSLHKIHRPLLSYYSLDFGKVVPDGDLGVPFPYLLINVGSGVSIIKVNSQDSFERVTGTCLGGGTALGLCHTLAGINTFEEMLEMSARGSGWLDLTVGELHGDIASDALFPAETIISAFGKLFSTDNHFGFNTRRPSDMTGESNHTTCDVEKMSHITYEDDSSDVEAYVQSTKMRRDICRSTVYMISYNLGYLGYLVAQVAKCTRIIFSGKYVATHPLTLETLTYAVKFCETHYKTPLTLDQPIEVKFVPDYDGYLGALGALISVNEKVSN